MEGPQQLYSSPLYAFSRSFHDAWDTFVYPDFVKRTARPLVAASFFDKRSRSFRWMGVALWNLVNIEQESRVSAAAIREIIEAIQRKSVDWQDFREVLNQSEVGAVAVRGAEAFIDSTEESEWVSFANVPPPKLATLHRHLLELYELYPFDGRLYIDGIVYRSLEGLHGNSAQRGAKIHHARGIRRKDYGPYRLYPWVEIDMFGEDNESLHMERFQCQEKEESQEYQLEYAKEAAPAAPRGFAIAAQLLDSVFPLSYKGSVERDHFLVVPIFDAWLAGAGWGSIAGNLLLLFESDRSLNKFEKQLSGPFGRSRFEGLCNRLEALSIELGRSALSDVLRASVLPPNEGLVDHFANAIIQLQDWERAIVYQNAKPQYCFSRVAKAWARCGGKCSGCISWKEAGSLGYLLWADDFFKAPFTSGGGAAEREESSSVRFAFEYPRAAVLPSDPAMREELDAFYVRQQVEALRGLPDKVWAARMARTRGVAEARRDFAHEIRHLAHALGKGWLMAPPRDASECAQLPVQWKAVPFPELFEGARMLLSLWAGDAPDVRTLLGAPTLSDLPRRCWDIAFNRIAAIVGTGSSLDDPSFSANELGRLKRDLDVLRKVWAPSEWFSVRVDPASCGEQAWQDAMAHHPVWSGNLCRLFICMFDDMLRHANPNAMPLDIHVTTEAGPRLTLRIRIEDVSLRDEELELLEDSEVPEDRELAGILTWISRSITSTKQGAGIIEDLARKLGGPVPKYSPVESASFRLEIEIPFPVAGGSDGAVSAER